MESSSTRTRERWEDAARITLATMVVVSLVVFWWWWKEDEIRELTSLPEAQRRELFDRTFANLNGVCSGDQGRRLPDFCEEQAELVMRLPECDATCQRLARTFLHRSRW